MSISQLLNGIHEEDLLGKKHKRNPGDKYAIEGSIVVLNYFNEDD